MFAALQDIPVYQVLHQEASIISAKLDEKRKQATESEIKMCTFQPKLVSEPLVKEGKIRKVSYQLGKLHAWSLVRPGQGWFGRGPSYDWYGRIRLQQLICQVLVRSAFMSANQPPSIFDGYCPCMPTKLICST